MKKITAFLACIAVLGSFALAQMNTNTPPSGMGSQHRSGNMKGMGPQEKLNWLSQSLNLNDQQKTNVQNIFGNMIQEIGAAVLQARTNADTQLQQVLTPDQFQRLQNIMAAHEYHWAWHHEGSETNSMEGSQTNQMEQGGQR